MDTLDFLRTVLAAEGFYCVVGLKKDSENRVQKFYPTLDAAAEVAQQLQGNGFDAYYALATFVDGESRRATNVSLLKSFWLDIDCGVGKPYANQVEGITAVKAFCKTTGLPRPVLVNSGRGVHVYWPLTQEIGKDEWLPVAQSLKDLCVKHELHADPAVTADVARILRVPGTFNYKGDEPAVVEILSTELTTVTLEAFKDVVGVMPWKVKDFTPREMDDATKSLLGSFVSKFKTILIKTSKGIGCQQIAHIAQNQADIEEPLWRAGLSVANYCVDRTKAIHAISKQHPDYDVEYTEKKASETKGPYTCESFEKLRPGGCEGCPNKGVIRSPISLGREVEEASEEDNIVVAASADLPQAPVQTYIIPKYPPPYIRGKNGGVFKRTRGEDVDIDVPVYHHDLYVVRRMVDPEVGEAVLIRLHLPHDGVREFTVPLAAVLAKDEFRKYMSASGVAVVKMDELMYYVTAWVNHLQMNISADVARRQFGWVDDSLSAFVVGDKEITANEVQLNPPSSATIRMFPYFRSRGTLDDWKETINFFNQPKMEVHQFALGCGFGSPLMAMTAVNGVIVHLWSKDSGLGKTVALLIGASIWGNPEDVMTTERDTLNSRMNRSEVYKNIVFPMDELTNATPKELSNMVYQYTGGHQRGRMGPSANTERYRGEVWQQICVSSGNVALLETISAYKAMPKGESTRVLEFHVTKADLPDKSVTDQLSLRLRSTYGTAYLPFLQYVMSDIEGVKALLKATQAKLDAAIGLKAEDRFYSAAAACGITGLIIAKRIGLIDFQIAPIVDWLVKSIKATKLDIGTLDLEPETILNNYLAENYNNILRIKSTDDGRNPLGDTEALIIPDGTPRVSLVVRYEYDIRKMFLMIKPFKEWCVKHQINYASLVNSLRIGRTKATTEKKRMSRGTRMNLPAAHVLCIDCTEFMNDEPESITTNLTQVPA